MLKASLLVVWPTHIDYPYFRWQLGKYGDIFEYIFICLSSSNINPNLEDFLRQVLPGDVVKPRLKGMDWRDNAVKELIEIAPSPYLLFMEQDFLMNNYCAVFESLKEPHDFTFFLEGNRYHPAFSLIKKSLLARTQQNFAAMPPHYDHFGLFFGEILTAAKTYTSLEGLGLETPKDYYHLAGLTQNYWNFINGEQFYKPAEFLAYNHHCINLPVQQNPEFLTLMHAIKDKYGSGDREGFISEFFK